jgi:hypothetical protein
LEHGVCKEINCEKGEMLDRGVFLWGLDLDLVMREEDIRLILERWNGA